jgi:hypothetical protein
MRCAFICIRSIKERLLIFVALPEEGLRVVTRAVNKSTSDRPGVRRTDVLTKEYENAGRYTFKAARVSRYVPPLQITTQ